MGDYHLRVGIYLESNAIEQCVADDDNVESGA